MDDTECMSPNASPSAVPRTGVRRVNLLPLVIAIGALALFTALIAMVAVKRANAAAAAQQEDVAQGAKRNADTSAMAKDVIGEYGPGLIPSAKRPAAAEQPASGVPIAPVTNPDAPPTPPRNTSPQIDPDEQQIRMAKMQQFQEAVKAKTSVSIERQPGRGPSFNDAPQTREEMLSRIADVRRQMEQNQSAGDSNLPYQAQLSKVRSSLGANTTGQQALSIGNQSASAKNSIQQFGNPGQGDRWRLDQEVQNPRSRFELRAPSVIPGVMISGVNSELPGQIVGQVSQDVYDSATGRHLLIPQGTRLLGVYSSDLVYGQSAVLIAWQRLVFPDGKALDIGSMPGTDSAGYSGFRDQENHHYVRIFASALLMSGVTAGVAYSQNQGHSAGYEQPSINSELRQALGQQLGQVTAQMIAKNLNIAPTLEIRPGYRFNIMVVKDLDFPAPYKGFDY